MLLQWRVKTEFYFPRSSFQCVAKRAIITPFNHILMTDSIFSGSTQLRAIRAPILEDRVKGTKAAIVWGSSFYTALFSTILFFRAHDMEQRKN